MAFAILRTAKLKSMGNIAGSLSHNYRTRETPNADPERTKDNDHTIATQSEAYEAIKARLPEKVRSNGVRCIEYLITASPEYFDVSRLPDGSPHPLSDTPKQKELAYFNEALKWLKEKHGAENVIAASIHRDEETPHLVAYVVPIDEKGRLNAREFLGGKAKLNQMQTDFADRVKHLGLERGIEGSKANHKTIQQYYTEIGKRAPTPQLEIPKQTVMQKLTETSSAMALRVQEEVLAQIKPKWDELAVNAHDAERVRKENKKLKEQLQSERKVYGRAMEILDRHPIHDRKYVLDHMEKASQKMIDHREKERQEKIEAEKQRIAHEKARRDAERAKAVLEKQAKEKALLDAVNAKREAEGKQPLKAQPTRSRGGMSR